MECCYILKIVKINVTQSRLKLNLGNVVVSPFWLLWQTQSFYFLHFTSIKSILWDSYEKTANFFFIDEEK